jgi:hypothetical protein
LPVSGYIYWLNAVEFIQFATTHKTTQRFIAMPKAQDKDNSGMSKPLSWLGVLLIAVVSGLIVRVLGDPIVEVTSPSLEEFFEDVEEFFEDPKDFFEDMNR